jgi:serralysin
MTKKADSKDIEAVNNGSAKICFERIIPDDLDPERSVRRALREQMSVSARKPLNAADLTHIARMAVVNSKKWQNGPTLKCRFLDGSPKMRKKTEAVAHHWEKYCDIKFKFVASGLAEIRISFFADDGSWSAVGRDALNSAYFPLHQPTMNYGWLRDDTDAVEYRRVVTHEFGHALGCIHEHESPKFTRKWNVQAVMKYFQGPPNYWSPDDIRSNVLDKYSPKGISATKYDPKSIMLYAFAAALFSDGLGPTNENTNVSLTDIKMIKAMYP